MEQLERNRRRFRAERKEIDAAFDQMAADEAYQTEVRALDAEFSPASAEALALAEQVAERGA